MLEVYKFECFTSPCEVQLYCDDKNLADNCAKDILQEAKRLELKYNYFDSNSYLSQLNTRETNILDSETKTVLSRAKQYYTKTNNIFDITMITKKENEDLSRYVGCEHFSIKRDKLYFTNEFTKLDLGGFIKEFSVDKSVLIIKKYKIKSALINFGGDIFVIGKKPNNEKFKVAIKNPQDTTKNIITVSLENEALTTSALYERAGHIQSSKKMQTNIQSTTVVSKNCVESGVYSTSLMCDETLKTVHKKYLIDANLEVVS